MNQILVVDDEPLNIEVMKALLETKGYQVDYAMSGKHCIDKITERLELVESNQAEMYKLILLDYSMPGMDGPVVAQAIRKLLRDSFC